MTASAVCITGLPCKAELKFTIQHQPDDEHPDRGIWRLRVALEAHPTVWGPYSHLMGEVHWSLMC